MLKTKIAKAILGFVAMLMLVVGFSANAYTFTAPNLMKGSTGEAVKQLQMVLNATPATQVATSGAGSPGMETMYFGGATKTAVMKYQTAHGLPSTGLVGPMTRAVLNGTQVVVQGNCPTGFHTVTPVAPTFAACAADVANQSGPVTVAMASDSPASGSVVSPSTGAVFAKYTFTGNGTVTSMSFKRTGISSNTSLTNIYLYDGATRLTDGFSLNSDNTATFANISGLFTVSGTRTISVVADVTGSDYSIGLDLTSITSGGVVSPVSVVGNVQYVAVVSNPATVDFGTVTPTGGSIDPAHDVVVFNSNVNVGTRDVTLTRLAMRQIGSVNTSDIANFRLMIDGTTVSTVATMDMNGYVTFALATPKVLTTGTRVFKVLADVNAGSSRTFQFSIRNKTDIGIMDTQYNAGVAATFNSSNFPASSVAATSINSGSVTVQKASDSTSGNVTLNGHDVVLARYSLTTYGESLKIETILAGFTSSNGSVGSLRNGRIMINGSQVGSTATLLKVGSGGTSFTTNYTLAAGQPATLEIRADLYDNDGTNDLAISDTVTGRLMVPGSANTQRLSSLGYITVPASYYDGNALSVQSAASLTMAKTSTYSAQTTAVPQTQSYKVASYSLSGNNVEDVNLDTVSVDFTAVSGTTFTSADLTDVTLKIDGTVIGSPKSTVTATGNSYSITKVLPKNGTMNIELWATIGSTITATNSIKATTTVSGVGASSSVASSTGAVDGQVITANSGSITATTDASRPDASMNDDSGTKTMAAFKFAAVTDSYTVTDLTFTVADVTTVSQMSLYDGTTLIAQKTAAGTTTFSGISWPIPAGTSKILTVKLDLGTVGVGNGSTGASTLVTLTSGLATNGAGTNAAITQSNPAGTAQYTFKAIPTLTTVTLPTTSLVAGTNTLAKFSVNTNGTGTVGWNRIVLNVTKTDHPTLSTFTLWNADSNTQIAGTFIVHDTANVASCIATDGSGDTCRLGFVPGTEQQVSGSVNYVLKATVGGALATADYVSTTIPSNTASFVASNTYSTIAGSPSTYTNYGTTPSFVWSDVSAASHDTTTSDWSTDYLVRSLPLDSQTLTK